MKRTKFTISILLFFGGSLFLCSLRAFADADANVEIVQTPDDGIQPRAVTDEQGTIHLLYYKKADKNGDLFYVTRQTDSSSWSSPIRVNTEEKTAVRNGSIGMAQLALGRNGRIHVAWFDMRDAKYWYTRLNDDATAFEPQRNLVTRFNKGIEASAALAADDNGNVYLAWHAGSFSNESRRRIYVTHSTDDGENFSDERRANPENTGSCACCGLAAITDREGALYISYRAAGENTHRDMTLLKSTDFAQSFTTRLIDSWTLNACPVTTTALGQGLDSRIVAAWETKGLGFLARVDVVSTRSAVGPPPNSGRQKHPAVAVNLDGTTLVAWGVGAGWASGGTLHWQVFDRDGNPTAQKGASEIDMPRASVAAAVALGDGGFLILY